MKLIWQAISLLALMTILCGLTYPVTVMALAQIFWPSQSHGSLIKDGEHILGSSLLAQRFRSDAYFWPRPSSNDYNSMPSGASNLGATSQVLANQISERRASLAAMYQIDATLIPIDMLTTSGSGLDPHISLENANLQMKRISTARGLNESKRAQLSQLIDRHGQQKSLVNVLLLNLDLRSMLSK